MCVKRVSREKLTSDEDKENFKNKYETIFEAAHIEENLNDFSPEEVFADVTSKECFFDLSVKKTSDDGLLTSVIVYGNESVNVNPDILVRENSNVTHDNRTLARKKQCKKRCFEDGFELSENNNPTDSCNYTHGGDSISGFHLIYNQNKID